MNFPEGKMKLRFQSFRKISEFFVIQSEDVNKIPNRKVEVRKTYSTKNQFDLITIKIQIDLEHILPSDC